MPGWSRFTIALCIPPFLGPPLPILVLSESSALVNWFQKSPYKVSRDLIGPERPIAIATNGRSHQRSTTAGGIWRIQKEHDDHDLQKDFDECCRLEPNIETGEALAKSGSQQRCQRTSKLM
ncbi:uncharacterized protein RAG0_12339 [Rhynchosporium agropyri]|uniref:Uncharacterized protein n=1 Tax=Rhynchosporium agropyri TaxID=914238 RepID=A0A1E1L8H0_9HELO|nr:uncharacterized protein RAG0_12339 [Rhynchosporium agropyri]